MAGFNISLVFNKFMVSLDLHVLNKTNAHASAIYTVSIENNLINMIRTVVTPHNKNLLTDNEAAKYHNIYLTFEWIACFTPALKGDMLFYRYITGGGGNDCLSNI